MAIGGMAVIADCGVCCAVVDSQQRHFGDAITTFSEATALRHSLPTVSHDLHQQQRRRAHRDNWRQFARRLSITARQSIEVDEQQADCQACRKLARGRR